MDNVARTDPSVNQIEIETRNPAELATHTPRERARYVLTSWAENERDCAWHLYTEGPFKPEWWSGPIEDLIRMMQSDGGNSAHVNAVQILLRGADVEVVAMLRHIASINEAALVRALILCGFIVAIHEDSREKTNRTIEYLLDLLEVHTAKSPDENDYGRPEDEQSGGSSLNFAGDIASEARAERFVGDCELLASPLWYPWHAALVGVTPGEQRWVVSAMYKALTACADALDDNRCDLDPFETALSRFLMLGEITDIFAAH